MAATVYTIPLGFTNCYIIQDKGTVMVDTGSPKKTQAFKRAMEALPMDAQDITLLIITHGHWDHIGSARDIKALTGAKIAMHEEEKPWLEKSKTPVPPGVTPWGRIFGGVMRAFLPFIKVSPTRVDLVLQDTPMSLSEHGVSGRVIHTPGHSPGSVSLLLETGEAFVGDLAMNKFPLRLSPDLPIFADDLERVKQSWRVLLDQGAETVYPAHGDPFPVDLIRDKLG